MKYDGTLELLKMTEGEYNSEITSMYCELARDLGSPSTLIRDVDDATIKAAAKERVADHDWFREFDGATYGAIVEWADVDPAGLLRWETAPDAAEALEEMAQEAVVEDVVAGVRELQEKQTKA